MKTFFLKLSLCMLTLFFLSSCGGGFAVITKDHLKTITNNVQDLEKEIKRLKTDPQNSKKENPFPILKTYEEVSAELTKRCGNKNTLELTKFFINGDPVSVDRYITQDKENPDIYYILLEAGKGNRSITSINVKTLK